MDTNRKRVAENPSHLRPGPEISSAPLATRRTGGLHRNGGSGRWNDVAFPVDRTRAGEQDSFDAGGVHGIEHVQCRRHGSAPDPGGCRPTRIGRPRSPPDVRQHRRRRSWRPGGPRRRRSASTNVKPGCPGAARRGTRDHRGEVVDHHHLVTPAEKSVRQVGSDEAGIPPC